MTSKVLDGDFCLTRTGSRDPTRVFPLPNARLRCDLRIVLGVARRENGARTRGSWPLGSLAVLSCLDDGGLPEGRRGKTRRSRSGVRSVPGYSAGHACRALRVNRKRPPLGDITQWPSQRGARAGIAAAERSGRDTLCRPSTGPKQTCRHCRSLALATSSRPGNVRSGLSRRAAAPYKPAKREPRLAAHKRQIVSGAAWQDWAGYSPRTWRSTSGPPTR